MSALPPTYARERFAQAQTSGVVHAIQVRPAKREPVVAVKSWDLAASADHARSTKRAVTLFQYEHLGVISSFLEREIQFSQTRRNICVRGFNLEIARGEALMVGDALLRVTGRCHPCRRMDDTLGPGGFTAMFGFGGWTASIVRAGVVQVGDVVRLPVQTHDDR